jgi:hypothetical protein
MAYQLTPGPPPLNQKKAPVRTNVTSLTDAMRGALLHQARISGEQIIEYNIHIRNKTKGLTFISNATKISPPVTLNQKRNKRAIPQSRFYAPAIREG